MSSYLWQSTEANYIPRGVCRPLRSSLFCLNALQRLRIFRLRRSTSRRVLKSYVVLYWRRKPSSSILQNLEHVDDFYLDSFFRAILSEIDDIRAGRWDDGIEAKVTGVPIQPVEPGSGATVCVVSFNFLCHVHFPSFLAVRDITRRGV
jgi:hypothetical protein